MKRQAGVFLSYSHKDKKHAVVIEQALGGLDLPVWRDERSILAGQRWAEAIENGIQRARGVVVLISTASASSSWVTYEYAFATGAGVPAIAVVLSGADVPDPIRRFQIIQYSSAKAVAKQIEEGLHSQSRRTGSLRADAPKLLAKFQEWNGQVNRVSGGKTPSLGLDLWIEHAPRATRTVTFEILDRGFRDPKWTVRRPTGKSLDPREFLTDDMNSWGDVEIWARGALPGSQSWFTKSRLYEALVRYYRGRDTDADIHRALRQIREN